MFKGPLWAIALASLATGCIQGAATIPGLVGATGPAPESVGTSPGSMGPGPSVHDQVLLEWYRVMCEASRLRRAMGGVVVDGCSDDWSEFQWSRSSLTSPVTGQKVDLELATAPSDDELLFCLRNNREVDGWLSEWSELRLYVEWPGKDCEQMQVIVTRSRTTVWGIRRGVATEIKVPAEAVLCRFDRCVEGRVDLRAIATSAEGHVIQACLDPRETPWLRVKTTLWEPYARGPKGEAPLLARHFGPAATSYRLCPGKYAPEWADYPEDSKACVVVPWFLDGQWFVGSGPGCWPTHVARVAYDFNIVDSRGCSFRGERRARKEDVYCWGAPVFAPSDGVVDITIVNREDQELAVSEGHVVTPSTSDGNTILVTGPIRWMFYHLKKGSIALRWNERVRRGQQIGSVGSSAAPMGPHLHCEVAQVPERDPMKKSGDARMASANRERGWLGKAPSAALVLEDVFVALNNGPVDRWEVRLPRWKAECGYFVRGIQPIRGTDDEPR